MTDTKKESDELIPPILRRVYHVEPRTCGKSPMDVPCPPLTTDDISTDHAINEWVLNHLPFRSEEQREAFAKKLMLDQKVKEKKEKELKRKKAVQKRKTLPAGRVGVKELTKHFPKDHGEETTERRLQPDAPTKCPGEGEGGQGGQDVDPESRSDGTGCRDEPKTGDVTASRHKDEA